MCEIQRLLKGTNKFEVILTLSLTEHSAARTPAIVLTPVTPLGEPLPENAVLVHETEPADLPFVLGTSTSYVLAPPRPALLRAVGGNSRPGGEGAGRT